MVLLRRHAAVVAIFVVLLISLLVYWWLFGTSSVIVDFHPTNFQAKAEKRFFYSIADELKNSDELDLRAPTLLHGRIKHFLVSPDGTRIAVVANALSLT